MRSSDAASCAAEAERIADADMLALADIDAAEVHRHSVEAEAVIDHNAVAFEVERAREDDGAAVGCANERTHGGAKIHAFVDAGEFAVEGAASAEAIGGGRVDGCPECAGPEWLVGAGGEDFLLEDAIGFDLFELVGARRDEFRWNGEHAGAVVRRMDDDGLREVAGRFAGEMDVQLQRRWLSRRLDVDPREREPGAAIVSGKELNRAAEPFAVDGNRARRDDAE